MKGTVRAFVDTVNERFPDALDTTVWSEDETHYNPFNGYRVIHLANGETDMIVTTLAFTDDGTYVGYGECGEYEPEENEEVTLTLEVVEEVL